MECMNTMEKAKSPCGDILYFNLIHSLLTPRQKVQFIGDSQGKIYCKQKLFYNQFFLQHNSTPAKFSALVLMNKVSLYHLKNLLHNTPQLLAHFACAL